MYIYIIGQDKNKCQELNQSYLYLVFYFSIDASLSNFSKILTTAFNMVIYYIWEASCFDWKITTTNRQQSQKSIKLNTNWMQSNTSLWKDRGSFDYNTWERLCCKYHLRVLRNVFHEITIFEHMKVMNDANLNKKINC